MKIPYFVFEAGYNPRLGRQKESQAKSKPRQGIREVLEVMRAKPCRVAGPERMGRLRRHKVVGWGGGLGVRRVSQCHGLLRATASSASSTSTQARTPRGQALRTGKAAGFLCPSPWGAQLGKGLFHPPPPPLEDFQNCRAASKGVGSHLWALGPASQLHPQPHSQLVLCLPHPAPHSSGQALGLEKGPRVPSRRQWAPAGRGSPGWWEEAGLLGGSSGSL